MRVLGGGQAPRIAQEAAGEGDGMRGHGELWRLEAPVRDKLGMDQHLGPVARRSHRETRSYIKKRRNAGPLRGRGRLHLKAPGGELRRYHSLRMNS